VDWRGHDGAAARCALQAAGPARPETLLKRAARRVRPRPRLALSRLLAVEHVEEEGKAMLYLVCRPGGRGGHRARGLAAR
jgi:hypothetical protein